MPYKSISELPSQFKGLPEKAQRMAMHTINSALKRGLSEERAFKSAWGAIKKSFIKKGDKWVAKSMNFNVYSQPIQFKSHTDGEFHAEGFLAVSNVDFVNDIILPECLQNMNNQLDGMKVNAKLGVEHDVAEGSLSLLPHAKVVNHDIRNTVVDGKNHTGLFIDSVLNKNHPQFETIKKNIETEFLDAFSIEFIPEEWEMINGNRVISKMKLSGGTFTGRPINTAAKITGFYAKSMEFLNNFNEVNDMEDEALTEEALDLAVIEFKAKVTAMEGKRKQMGMSVGAFYAFPRLKKLPIFDKAHAKNAMARFNQTQGMSSEEKKTARNKILRAAKKFGIDVNQFQKVKSMEGIDMDDTETKEAPETEEKKEEKVEEAVEKKEEEKKEETEEKEEGKSKEVNSEVTELKSQIKKLKTELKTKEALNALVDSPEFKSLIKDKLKEMKPENKALAEQGQQKFESQTPKGFDVKSFGKRLYGESKELI